MNEKTGKKIMKMHKKGMTTYAIAKQLGLSQTGVKYVLDSEYREHMKQISRERSSKPKSPQPNNAISSSDIAWLSQHKQSVERRTKMLKGAGIFFYYFTTFFVAPLSFAYSLLLLHTSSIFAAPLFIIDVFVLAFSFSLLSVINADKYFKEITTGLLSGFLLGIMIALVYIAPMISIAQYPISMQVFYPNHPNMTITQNCTAFTTTISGSINGQPINPQNTTECNLPERMAQYEYNPFNCNISGKNITCTAALDANVTWKGTILNVSKR